MGKILKSEIWPGISLFFFGLLAIIISNSPWETYYNQFFNTIIKIHVSTFNLNKSVLSWINDGLMALFFLMIAVQIRQEFYHGGLGYYSRAVLPFIAATGGVIVPACIFILLNDNHSGSIVGWAIPTATDVAFALGIVLLLGQRIPVSLKILLTTIAIFDDLIAICIIAIFYTEQLSYLSLSVAAICIGVLIILNLLKVPYLSIYGVVGLILWVCVVKSGVHATLTGVVLAFLIPIYLPQSDTIEAPLYRLERALYPWVCFFILPVFAFANAGVSFEGLTWKQLTHPVTLGIGLGLFLGKQIGIFCFSYFGVLVKIAKKPEDISWRMLYGMSVTCGIGFTMSLFICSLAYPVGHSDYVILSRLGIVTGSLCSAIMGFLLLYCNTIHYKKNYFKSDGR